MTLNQLRQAKFELIGKILELKQKKRKIDEEIKKMKEGKYARTI